MLTPQYLKDATAPVVPQEGDLYRALTIGGHSFVLNYGYYEDFEREYNNPIPIYPDFLKSPVFTDEGIPLVTAMQDVCDHYCGRQGGDGCGDCHHFQPCEDLFGLCICPRNRLTPAEDSVIPKEFNLIDDLIPVTGG